ncbi:hypothetical protein [Hansschlegelia zhihuaiae]|uniref:Uncharacterized protein n=1 Tax=Hansschlegelia zhihuaiae TaxID=405005 RepID=A0A4V1KJ51_9HYPH|nr:hypothetical protein [Hansschlegelia zhihuaiae]RXF72972.1 hypothetical protein EK403_12585 [Hansschlegelia zhihuaiae]
MDQMLAFRRVTRSILVSAIMVGSGLTQLSADERDDPSCADYDRRLFAAIESAGLENYVEPSLLFEASLAVLDARHLCGTDEAAGLQAYKNLYID